MRSHGCVVQEVYSSAGDWSGLYINGRLVYENHSVRLYDIERELKNRGLKNPLILKSVEMEADEDGVIVLPVTREI